MSRTAPSLAAFSALLLLSACTVGPDFVRPQAITAPSYTGAGDKPLSGEQQIILGKPVHEAWWEEFRSPALTALIVQAAAGNRDIKAAQARLAQALEYDAAARGALLPRLSLGASVGEQNYSVGSRTPLNVSLPDFTYYALTPSVSFPLDLFGGTRRTIERSQAYADYQKYTLETVWLSLFANVAAQSLKNAGVRAQIANMQEVIAGDEHNVALVQGALDVGSATRTQLLSVQSQLASDRTVLPDLRQAEAVSRHALAVLAGQPVGGWTMPELTLEGFTLPAQIPASLPSELVHRRPDILAAEAKLHMASAAIGIATANLYPQITLSASLTRQALSPDSLFSGTPNLWNIAAGLTQPLFNGGALSAERRAAIRGYEAALAEYQQVVLSAFADVADNLQALGNDAERVSAQKNAAQTAAAALDLARRSYAVGNSGILDVIDAERRLAEASLGASRARTQQLQDTVKLYVSLGGVKIPAPQDAPLADASAPCCTY